MAFESLVFRVHAVQRMFQRHVGEPDVRHVLSAGTVIERYLEDRPYPSYLMLGWVGSRPLHVVVADNSEARETIIITVYEPDPLQWDADFARRKR